MTETEGLTSNSTLNSGQEPFSNADKATDVEAIVKVFVLDFPFMLICGTVFGVYASLWDRQKVHGWIVMATSASFLIRALAIAIRDLTIQLAGWNIKVEAPVFCIVLGLLHHLAYLSSYCWTLVLAFNLWDRVRRSAKIQSKIVPTKRLLLYSFFGFGVPIINIIVASILEWEHAPAHWNVRRPEYGKECKIQSTAYFLYLGIPNIILTVPNLVFLAHCWFHLWKTTKESNAVRERSSEQHVKRNMVRPSFKVFLIMGGLFIIDSVFNYAGLYEISAYLKVPVETICRVGIAAACAWVFLCNEKVKGHLQDKYPRGIGKLFVSSASD